ncbi:hypothetical protein [uncultured Campylobacter sp.]|mgnify:CR=1 FL=1|uniref:hypothetical protein n=1 Tax=uncultured Campylobacter sp. TaxID=218934 RepID=UPI0026298885|nr:hypothetical protein [uncultured Campylobacter sp.]
MASQEKNSRARSAWIADGTEISRDTGNLNEIKPLESEGISSGTKPLNIAKASSDAAQNLEAKQNLKASQNSKAKRDLKTMRNLKMSKASNARKDEARAKDAARNLKAEQVGSESKGTNNGATQIRKIVISRSDLNVLSLLANGAFGKSCELLRPSKLSVCGINFVFSCADAKKGDILELYLRKDGIAERAKNSLSGESGAYLLAKESRNLQDGVSAAAQNEQSFAKSGTDFARTASAQSAINATSEGLDHIESLAACHDQTFTRSTDVKSANNAALDSEKSSSEKSAVNSAQSFAENSALNRVCSTDTKSVANSVGNFISNSTENFIKNPASCELVARIDVSDVYAPSASEVADSVFQNAYAEQTAVQGRITLLKNGLAEQIARIKKVASSLAAPKISAFFTCADPIHRVHERLIRHMIDKADFVVIFLTGTSSADALPYELRKKTLSYLLQNFLVAQRAMMIDLGSLAIFDDKPALQCAIAKNLGINKIIFGQNHANMELFFEGGGVHSVLDEYQKRGEIEILLMPEYVYCEKCKVLVSTKNCPHGAHHHVHYRAQNLKALLRAGILPPAIFMRKEISAMILSELFPARFSDLQKLYDELFPNSGILQSHGESEFYEQLMQLYQTSALKT